MSRRWRRILPALLGGAAVAGLAALGAFAADPRGSEEAPPSTVRRLTEAQYRRVVADVFGPDIKVVGRFDPDLRVEGLLAVGAGAVSVTAAGLEQYEDIARGVAAQVTDPAHRDKLVGCGPAPADPQGGACAARFFARTGLRLYRRPLSSAETRGFAATATASAARLGDYHAGLAAALTGLMTAPDFLFRVDAPGPTGREVDGYSKAVRLSFLLWNTTPDDELLAAAGRGDLETAQGLTRQVDRLMASPRLTEGVRAFFTDFLQLDDINHLSKDTLIYPAFTGVAAEAAREQTLRTITDHLVERSGDYRDLFTSRRFAMNRALGPLYDIPVAQDGWYIHEFPEGDPRAGLLSQVSLLAQHSHPGRTSPTLRGKAILEIFLCETVPTPPANVNFAVVQDVNNPTLRTTRARLQAHLDDEECASCHKHTDPLGLGLEQFDGAGQFRTSEQGETIDVSGGFEKKSFRGGAGLGERLRESPRLSGCLTQTAWRYAYGRQPRVEDLPAIEALKRRFAEDDYRVTTLLRTIALDPAFYALPSRAVRAPRMRTTRLSVNPNGGGA